VTVRKPLRRANAASARRKARGRLVLKLLGPPRIERGGLAVEMDTRKATALVAYLAVTGQPQARDSLAALLWPDAVAERARGALRRTLSTLRTGLGGEEVRVEGVRISIDPEAIDLDVRRFRALVVEDRLDEAVTAYTGDFLAGFTLRDSAEFDEWQAAQAEELRGELAGVLERLASSEEPRRALAVEDSPHGIAAAKGAKRASFAGLPKTKVVTAGFRGTSLRRTGPRFAQPLETFGVSVLKVQVRKVAQYPRLVATVFAGSRVITHGAIVPKVAAMSSRRCCGGNDHMVGVST